MKFSKLHSFLFLLLVVLIIYFPAITGVINTVDDIHIIEVFGINGQRTLSQIFLPRNQFYFRPLIELTYYFDNLLWGLNPTIMHFENVLLHAINVLLVYLIATIVSSLSGNSTSLPFISAFLFAIHPINTEAICWIAGRTDPLAAFFILLSTFFLLKALQYGHIKYFYYAFVAMLLSILAKETSVMLIPASVLIIYSVKGVNGVMGDDSARMRRLMVFQYGLLLVVLVGYAVVRLFMKPVGTDNAFSMMFEKNYDLFTILNDFILAAGFYVKKLFIPFPLNFAIYTISEWYILVGIVVVLFSAYFIVKRNIISTFALIGLLFIFPAVIVKLVGINWTPVAERYLYIPSSFFSIGLAGVLVNIANHSKNKAILYSALVIVAVIIASLTYARNLVWQDNQTLYQDAVLKSPDFGDIHNELGVALANKGNYTEAKKHFILADKLSSRSVIRELARVNLLKCELDGKSNIEKKAIIEEYIALHKSVNSEVLKMLRNLTLDISQIENDNNKKIQFIKEVIALNDRIFREIKDPLCLYQNGQQMLILGDNSAALAYFRKTIAVSTPDAYYYEAANKLVKKLEN